MTPQQRARAFMHDAVCASEHCSGSDHADRTQREFGRDAVRAWGDGQSLAPVVHDHACPSRTECPNREKHIAQLSRFAAKLLDLLDAA